MTVSILHRDDVRLGGFAGLTEHRLVMDPSVWGAYANGDSWPGLGNFVYLADARFQPRGETRLHGHHEIDVISLMVEGRIAHEGSLEHGTSIEPGEVQVQRAGGDGFSHNEINPDDAENRMIQIWLTPERAGERADYRLFRPDTGTVTRVYGGPVTGNGGDGAPFPAATTIDIANLRAGQKAAFPGEAMAYVTRGEATIGGTVTVRDGDLVRADGLDLEAGTDAQIIVAGAQA